MHQTCWLQGVTALTARLLGENSHLCERNPLNTTIPEVNIRLVPKNSLSINLIQEVISCHVCPNEMVSA